MADVTLKNVIKRYSGNVLAVDNVNLHIEDGEFLVLLGPSGCGKTTTLRMIAGLEDITEGDIFIGERRVTDLPPGDRDIAFVFQFYALYPHLSVRDNITFPLRAQNVPKAEVEKRLREVAKQLQIEHVLNRRPGRLPSGEQQRVALGRAIIRRPQVFLMDEPLTNLDASLRADMRVELKHLQGTLGTTMVYVTHDQIEAMSMSHRIAVMNLGILQQVASPLEIYNQPATLFVGTFIGSPPMNTFACRVDGSGHLTGTDSRFSFQLNAALSELVRQARGQELVLGIRSEDVRLSDVSETGGTIDFTGIVRVREPLGDETIYQIQIEDFLLLAKTPPRQIFGEGQPVYVSFDQSRVHLFDKTTGYNLRTAKREAVYV
jgi:multiple sugar transport system ATP-binding protein